MDKKIAKEFIEKTRLWFEENGVGCKAVVGISGGKDSTVVGALLTKALGKDNVVGVMIPNGEQKDIEDSRRVCKKLGIHALTINIVGAVSEIRGKVMDGVKASGMRARLDMDQFRQNLPPRVRMTTLYAVAQALNGRVVGTGNAAETYVGYFTLAGDGQCDFNPLSNLFVDEVIELGRCLRLPNDLLVKPPADGLCGNTDEEQLGFKYASVKKAALKKPHWVTEVAEIENCNLEQVLDVITNIELRHHTSQFKRDMIHVPTIGVRRDWLSGEIIGVS